MTFSKLYLAFLLLVVQTCSIFCAEDQKSSITFVIDDTGSMNYEIDVVKEKIDSIFDSANDSLIENFIVVTFNDEADAQLRTITKDRYVLKAALANIQVHGGGDCPENALTGIKLGLEVSQPYSSLFVFTDASAKDYNMYEEIESLAEEKNIRIFFILTGHCGRVYEDSFQVYYHIAKNTEGQVFKQSAYKVRDILVPLVIQNMRRRRHVLPTVENHPTFKKIFSFPVYKESDEVFIYISGLNPRIRIVDEEGRNIEYLLEKMTGVSIVKLRGRKPGQYVGEVTSTSEISVQFLSSTNVNFLDEFPTRFRH